MMRRVRFRDDRGASAAEYGLLVAAVAAAVVVILMALGTIVAEVFGDTCEHVATTVTSGTCD